MTANEADLFARVVANPDDETACAVLGDHWVENGDPRGEFVALQLLHARRETTRADHERMIALQREHAKGWQRDLAAVADAFIYRRGFLDDISLDWHRIRRATEDDIARALQDRELGTVRYFSGGASVADVFRRFLFSPSMPNVRYARIPDAVLEDVLAAPPPKLRALKLESDYRLPLATRVRAVESVVARGHFDSVTVHAPEEDLVPAYCQALLPLVTPETAVIVQARYTECKATRTSGEIQLESTAGDKRLAAAARAACPGAPITFRPSASALALSYSPKPPRK